MRKRTRIVLFLVVLLALGWYAFTRPTLAPSVEDATMLIPEPAQ